MVDETILFVTPSAHPRIESRVMHQMVSGLLSFDTSRDVQIIPKSSLSQKLKSLLGVLKAKTIVFHSSLILSAPEIILAKLLRKNIVVLIWDVYPVTIRGLRYDRRPLRKALDFFEVRLIKMSTHVFVPSADFQCVDYLKHAEVLNLWPQFLLGEKLPESQKDETNKKIKIIFAGQINATRDVKAAIAHLDKIIDHDFIVTIASRDPLPKELSELPFINHVGYLNQNDLKAEYSTSDLGLICLSENLDTPGFPSKIFSYLQAGLPCLYFGRPLESYVSIMEGSGAGKDIRNLKKLDQKDVEDMKERLHEGAKKFRTQTCITEDTIGQFISKLKT